MLGLGRIACLGDALADSVVAYGSNVALVEADRHRERARYTYREVAAAARGFAATLKARGFRPGDRCAILMTNQPAWPIAAIGALWAGAVLVPLDYKLTADEQAALLAHAKPRALVTEWPVWRKLREVAGDTLETAAVFVGDAAEAPLSPASALEEAFAAEGSRSVEPRRREDVACIVYSSGTGGRPKGCMLTHGNYLAQAEALVARFPMREDDRYFSILPTNHAIDFMCGFLIPLMSGASVVHQRTLRAQFLAPTMKRYGVTHMALVPRILKALEEALRDKLDALPDWQRLAIEGLTSANEVLTWRGPRHAISRRLLAPIHDAFGGQLRLMFCGGAFVDRASAEFFYRLGLPVAIGYGLTEAGTVLTVNDLSPFRGDTVGTPVDGVELELRGRDADGVGEVWVRGATVMAGYLDDPEQTAEALVDGWLRTGDLGTMDASGHLKLCGRAKNMVVTDGGKNVYPEDVEAAFDGLCGAEELCVLASGFVWPEKKGGVDERLVLVVRPKDTDDSALRADLAARNRRLADYKRVGGLVLWSEAFPRTASLKVKRADLAQALATRTRNELLQELA